MTTYQTKKNPAITISILILLALSSNTLASGIPLFDMTGSATLTKHPVPLKSGSEVVLVSIMNECHYYGRTTVGPKGNIVIRIAKSSCGEIEKSKDVISMPLKTALDRGGYVWIPLDGLLQKIEKFASRISTPQ